MGDNTMHALMTRLEIALGFTLCNFTILELIANHSQLAHLAMLLL